MLTLHRTLHEMQVEPLETNERWEGTSLPPFTLLVGQVGVIQKSLSGNWLSLCPSPTLTVTKDVKPEFIDLTASIARVNGWLTPVVWQDVVKQWTRRPTPLTEQVELESISLCRWICSIIYVERKIDLSDHNRVYYHRCPAARSDPRSFWGYFSTSKDPQAWSNNLENKGWKLRYRINTYMWKIVDDWGYKYRKLLAEGLRSMPGSFPTEAVETDLDEE
ncbi:hypothetical protein FRC09_003298 [Ceratobasidium sp. 395]|nr:hypothetical protein FRC09_003298 [Ceratobasidium sp. 395]